MNEQEKLEKRMANKFNRYTFFCRDEIDLDDMIEFSYTDPNLSVNLAWAFYFDDLSTVFLCILDRTHLFSVLIDKGFKI